jgi:hypothetical protein
MDSYLLKGGIASLLPPLPLGRFTLVWDWDDMTRPIGEEGIFDFATFMTARLPNNDNNYPPLSLPYSTARQPPRTALVTGKRSGAPATEPA